MPGNAFMANQFSESNGFCTSVENAWSVEYNYGLRENRSDRQLQPKDLQPEEVASSCFEAFEAGNEQ